MTAVSVAHSAVPAEATNSYRFSFFNALNFQIACGNSMILFAKALGGSATTIGIVAALAPMMTVLQLPTASYITRFGYKGFVLFGWFSRFISLLALASLPLFTFLEPSAKIALMLVCLFVFNVIRGISTGAWLPWITSLVPESARGAFLRSDQLSMQCGGLMAAVLSTLILWSGSEQWRFACLFLISAFAAKFSLDAIRKIPDIPAEEQKRSSAIPVPWLEILRYPPFFKLLRFNVVYNWVIGGLGAFIVSFLNGRAGFSPGQILAAATFASIGAFISVPFFALVLDRSGSKPLLQLALALYLWVIILWTLISGSILPASYWLVGSSYLSLGIAGGLFSIANVRIAMDTMPIMGRAHFFALFTVFASVSLGLAPIFWGIFLDTVGRSELQIGAFEINRFSIYFLLLIILTIVTFLYSNFLVEERGKPLDTALRDVVILARLKLYSRFLNR
ncbi:MAG: MFS transporter [Verrucomicrobia bacterium]|nr:MFS transporter [Verrucomicrobiota bacterium]